MRALRRFSRYFSTGKCALKVLQDELLAPQPPLPIGDHVCADFTHHLSLERRQHLGFAPKPRETLGNSRHFGRKHLDGDVAAVLYVAGAKNLSSKVIASFSRNMTAVLPNANSGPSAV